MLAGFHPQKGSDGRLTEEFGAARQRRSAVVPAIRFREIAVTLALAITLSTLPGVSRAGFVETPVCQAHLDKIEVKLSGSPTNVFERADELDCATLHGHVRVMLAARNVYRRCATGQERAQQVGVIESSIDTATNRISESCLSR